MKIETMIRMVIVAAIATAAVACAKGLNDQENPKIPEGMGELTLNQVRLDDTSPQGAAQRATRATVSALPEGATLRLYAFKTGAVDFTQLITSRTYTVDAAGTPILDAGQERLYLPLGAVDVYLVGPVQHNIGTTQAPDMVDVAAPFSISPRQGADLIADYNTATIVAGKVNPLPAMVLEHKMARVQVVIEQHELGAYENMVVSEVKLFGQPTEGTYTLNPDGGAITATSTPATDVAFAQITEEETKKRYSITTVLLPQAERELKIETTFSCNQKNVDVDDKHPTLKYRQSGLITSELLAGTATQFSTKPLTPVEIKWRIKVLPWNALTQETIVVPGVEQGLKNPPTAGQYVEIDGVRWTTGNLIAVNENECKVGAPADGGLYFQFGSLIGWTGGADGTGTGQGSQTADKRVWPIYLGVDKPTHSWQVNSGANISKLDNYFFNYSANGWNVGGKDLRDFAEPIAGDAGTGTLASGRYAKFGVGDPCTYYLGNPWRLPTQAEIFALKESGYGTWQQYTGANGRWFGPDNAAGAAAATAIFLPASGHRYYNSSNNWQIGNEGRYGTTTIVSDTKHNYMYISSGVVNSPDNSDRRAGLPVRCVSKAPSKAPTNPVNPPTASDYVTIDGLKWTKGNLVASSSTADGSNGCKVGAPTDGGLYFQFGSLIGWKGGATANNGTGVGSNPNTGSGTQYWGGATSWNWSNDAMVWPAAMASTPSSWPKATSGTAHQWFFSGQGATSGEINVKDPTKGVGDPCTYYLGAPWRTPTAAEYLTLLGASGANTNKALPLKVNNYDLFFPASGTRLYSNGSFASVTTDGYGWSSSVGSATGGYSLYFYSSSVYPQNNYNRSNGFPVRCVSGTYVPPSNPVNPPTASDYVTIDGVKWAKGNLVASSSTAGNINGCKVGAPEDGGLYFQFGSLIGYKGGATANNGTGQGVPSYSSGYWGGATSWSWSNDAMVWPTAMASTPTAWSPNAEQATEANAFKKWYFDFSGTSQNGSINYSNAQSDIRSYTHPTLGALKEGKMASLGIGDPCTYYLGSPWRLPTAAEYTAVDAAGRGGWTTNGGMSGRWFGTNPGTATSSVFFPASGARNTSSGAFVSVTENGLGWSSSVGSATNGFYLVFSNSTVAPQLSNSRPYGLPVRCVAK